MHTRACSNKPNCSDCEADFSHNKAKIRRCTVWTSRIFNTVMRKISRKTDVERLCEQALKLVNCIQEDNRL